MAVVSVHRGFEQGGRNASRAKQRFDSFLVQTNDPDDDADVVLAHDDVPQIGDSRFPGSIETCIDTTAEMFSAGVSLTRWVVRCEYSNTVTTGVGGDTWMMDTWQNMQAARTGFFFTPGTGAPGSAGWTNFRLPIMTSAFGRIEQPIEAYKTNLCLKITRTMTVQALIGLLPSIHNCLNGPTRHGTVNLGQFGYAGMVYEEDEVRFVDISTSEVRQAMGQQELVGVNFIFMTQKGGFYHDVQDEDVYEFAPNPLNGIIELTPIKDSEGRQVVEPKPLNGNGQRLIIGQGPGAIFQDQFKFLRWRIYDRMPYASIGFPAEPTGGLPPIVLPPIDPIP